MQLHIHCTEYTLNYSLRMCTVMQEVRAFESTRLPDQLAGWLAE